MKKIAFILTDLWQGGGGETVACNLANSFTRLGYDVTMFSLTQNYFNKVSPSLHSSVKISTASTASQARYKWFNKIGQYNELKKFLSLFSFDIILGIGSYPSLLLSLLPFQKGKIIACMHGAYAALPNKWKIMLYIFMRRCDLCVCLTDRDVKNYEKICQTYVIPNSIVPQEERFSACYEAKKILAVGRLDFLKGYDLMIDVMASFHKRCPDWKLVIRGSGPMEAEIHRLIVTHQLQDVVTLLPHAQDLQDDYLSASILIHTSRSEGLPMVLLEAASYGLPMIAYDCLTGPAEIITDGENGFLIPCFDKDKFVFALESLAKSEEKRRLFGHNARIKVRNFSPDKILEKWLIIFREIA